MVTVDRLKELLSYDSAAGTFTWRVSRGGRVRVGSIAGKLNKEGYRVIGVDKRHYFAHRLAWLYMYGKFPEGDVDHIDHNRLNNSIANLRVVTRSENQQNRTKQKNNKSGFKGVKWSTCKSKWHAQIAVNGVKKHLGYFESPTSAYAAYQTAAASMHTHNPCGTPST